MPNEAILTEIVRRKPPSLVFRLDGETFSVGCDRVVGILGGVDILPAADTPNFVRGIVVLDGNEVPVVDMQTRLNRTIGAITPLAKVVVVEVEGDDRTYWLGVLVDALIKIGDIPQ